MFGKIKLMCCFCLCSGLVTTNAQHIKQQKLSPRLLIIDSYFSADYSGSYTVLRGFIVNYSNDTLRIWGTSCRPSEFFTITNNDYMRLANKACTNSVFEQIVIPPRRSLTVPLRMLIEKQPHEIVRLKVKMKFYKWFASDDFIKDRKHHQPEILTDTISLKFNKDGGSYYAKSDWEERTQKEKLNLPTTNLYLLAANERKQYTVTVDETKISKATEEEYSYRNQKVFLIPVTVHNNSDEPLKYYSMSCSWQEFYQIDNKNLSVFISDCDKNIPTEVLVPAHSIHTNIVPFFLEKTNLKTLQNFRVGLNINKNVKDDPFSGYDEELRRYNIVWSNNVQFINK